MPSPLLHLSDCMQKKKNLDSKELTLSMIVSATSFHAKNLPTPYTKFPTVFIKFLYNP